MANLTIGTLNVRGLCNTQVRHKVFNWFKQLKLKIILLQETYCKTDFEHIFNSNWNGKIFHNFTDSSHSRGVCIMFDEIINQHCSENGRLL